MRIAAIIAGILLGLLFLMASVTYLFDLIPKDKLPSMTPLQVQFMDLFASTRWMTFVKVLELLGGVLVMVPKTRRLALLILGPIIVNILAYHLLVAKGDGLANPLMLAVPVLALFLVWVDRRIWAAFIRGG